MRHSMRLFISIALGCFAFDLDLTAAGAVEFPSHSQQFNLPDNPKCTCRYKGEHLPLGTLRCLQTPDGPRTAECVTEQNITSWRPGREPCPQAGLARPLERLSARRQSSCRSSRRVPNGSAT